MITIETGHTTGAAQTIAAEVLGHQPGVSQAGRLGTELAFSSLAAEQLDALTQALGEGGRPVYVTDSDLLDVQGVAAMLGILPSSVHRYRVRGVLPEPDAMLGRSPGWHADTIRAWQQARPGRTGRPRKDRP
ncbi:MAG: helix-turn-helix transcriptional regulator [Nocardioidaceae bacterium]